MDRETNHRIRKRFNDGIYNIARYTEIMLSIVILVVIALAGLLPLSGQNGGRASLQTPHRLQGKEHLPEIL